MIDDLKTIEKSKRVQWDQQAGYRELFRHSQIWERQAAIACRGRSVCFIPSHSIAMPTTRVRLLREISRIDALRDRYEAVRDLPYVNVEPVCNLRCAVFTRSASLLKRS